MQMYSMHVGTKQQPEGVWVLVSFPNGVVRGIQSFEDDGYQVTCLVPVPGQVEEQIQ